MKNLSERFQSLIEDPYSTVPYYSISEFSMHQLLEFLLSISGPAKVRVSSFSLSEVALRSFVRSLDNGMIIQLQCLLDLSVRRHRLGLLYFASNVVSGIALAKNHAKIILIENDSFHWVVVGSANLNENDKIEAGIVSGSGPLYMFFSKAFDASYSAALKISRDDFN